MGEDFEWPRDEPQVRALADALAVKPSQDVVHRLGQYAALVASWNQKLDLTAARGARAQAEVLLADAFVLGHAALVPEGSRCVDVGSGAGAPVLPLLLLRPDLNATLVEPKRKRVAFLRTAIGALGLAPRAQVREESLSEAGPLLPGAPFDVALSRATFAPAAWLARGARLAARTLVLLATDEPPAPPPGVRRTRVERYAVPSTGAARAIAVYDRSEDSRRGRGSERA